jgi:hypothetical protein
VADGDPHHRIGAVEVRGDRARGLVIDADHGDGSGAERGKTIDLMRA